MNQPFKSEFLDRIKYFYKNLDGTYTFPNSAAGDILKIGKKEIEELIERMKPRKPLRTNKNPNFRIYNCPNCRKLKGIRNQYCGNCGQALDWRNDESD